MGQAPSYLTRALCWALWPAGKSLRAAGVTETAPSPAAGTPLGVGQEAYGDPQQTPATFQRGCTAGASHLSSCISTAAQILSSGTRLGLLPPPPPSAPGPLLGLRRWDQVPAPAWPGATRLPQGLGTAPALAAPSPPPPVRRHGRRTCTKPPRRGSSCTAGEGSVPFPRATAAASPCPPLGSSSPSSSGPICTYLIKGVK